MKLVMRVISLQFSILMFLMTVWLVASGIFNFYNLSTMHLEYTESMYEQIVYYLIFAGIIIAITSSAGYFSLKAGTKGANNQGVNIEWYSKLLCIWFLLSTLLYVLGPDCSIDLGGLKVGTYTITIEIVSPLN